MKSVSPLVSIRLYELRNFPTRLQTTTFRPITLTLTPEQVELVERSLNLTLDRINQHFNGLIQETGASQRDAREDATRPFEAVFDAITEAKNT